MGGAIVSDLLTEFLIPVAAVIGIAFALFQWLLVSKVQLTPEGQTAASANNKNGIDDYLIEEEEEGSNEHNVFVKCAEIQKAISEGATSFLFTEYQYVGIFMVAFAVLIFLFLGSVEGFSTKEQSCTFIKDKTCKPALFNAIFSTVAFLLGAVTSVVSGFLGMKIATFANARTTLEARKGVGKAFIVAFRSGAVMGFLLAANGLFVLYLSINLFKLYYGDDWEGLFEAITGYGLGGSSMALFGRVGGGIYTKAADVGADLVGKIERNIPEDDPRNPAVIADNVGDNVGDIAGMGSDLFGSYAESSCAALVVASISSFGTNHDLTGMLYPLLISSMGIIICLITTLFATDFFEIKAVKEIEPALKRQLIISTALMTLGIAIVSWLALPSSFTIFNFGAQKEVKNWELFFCVAIGLWAGLAIGFVTEYYTSNAYSPVQDVADSCRTGAATNVIFGLALGYKSVIIPLLDCSDATSSRIGYPRFSFVSVLMIPLKSCKSPSFYHFQFSHPTRIPSTVRSATNASSLSAAYTSPRPPSETVSDLAAYRLSLLAGLARRGLLSAARNVTQRIITASSSLEAAAAFNNALSLGITIDLGRLLRSLVAAGQLLKADALFTHCSKDKVSIDPTVLNSMIECYCKLGNLDVAETYLDELVKIESFLTARACVTVLRARCGEDKYVEAFNLFCAIAAQEGLLPPLSIYNLMISGLCSIGCLDHARFMFDFMFNLGLQLTPRSYKSLVYGLSKGNRVLEAADVFNKMESRGFWLDRTLCTSLINGYQKEGRMELALKVFNRMKELWCCQPDTYAYNTIIHGFLKLGYVDSACKLCNQMVERGLKWNVVTYCMMINWYSKNRRVDRAMELMKEMSESGLSPNLQCYTALVTALCIERRLIEVEQLFDKMLDSSIVPDHVMFTLLIKFLPRGHRPMVVQKTLHAIADIDCKIDLLRVSNLSSSNEGLQRESEVLLDEIMKSDVFPVHLIFNVLLCVFCTEGKIDVACTFMEKMLSWGYEPSISTYNFLIRCICKEGQLDGAGLLVRLLMHHRGVPSTVDTYFVKINALCKIGHVDLALEQLDEMIQKGFDPTASIYDSIIGSLCRAGRLRKADMTFNSMLKAGVNPDEVVYATLINGHCVLGRAVKACHLFDQMMQRGLLPSSRAYSALINGLIKKNMFRNACHYLDRMLEDGFVPDTVLHTMLVNQFLRKGEVGLALDIFDLMVRNQIEPDLVAYGSLICGLCGHNRGARNFSLTKKLKRYIVFRLESRGNVTSRMLQSKGSSSMSTVERVNFALGKVQDLINSGFLPDLHIYNGIINGLCRINRIEDAYKHIVYMHDNGIAPNQVTYTILMKAFIRSGDINYAVWLFNQMNYNGCIPDKISYNTLIVGFCIAGRVIEGLSLAHGMLKRGLLPNKILYDQLLKSLIPCCPSNLAILLLEEMISHNYVPHSSNYNRLLWVLSTRTNLLELHRVYNLILKIGRMPDENTKRQLLKTCCSQGEFDMALNIEENIPINNV